MENVKKEYSMIYSAVKQREYDNDPFKYAIKKMNCSRFNSIKYHNDEETRLKKQEYNKQYWAKKQLAKIST
jgi:hypothetical protein